ncbi:MULTISPECIES: acyl carrier protein [Terrisporobacter]|uniref:Acyl carrier protein n=3 Tax=Terrisporobacter TaxID=1505652 RepID=A0ABY9Q4W1_9FIRM|nr:MULTISPECIES: acyl carrier protein [Terrisporobacter]MBN9648158.1 acyl carrier protein [Terrisporobacter glycolicus]MDU4861539.1 acyl carrier protein [Terrisporobacter othiniensis]MCC3868851.1 acyl carrier protein [Terrisporobacter mayombei]MDU6995542.1 acyl carrier protein [Terrisporobacter othiniensis]UEL49104.1 acyl carrier protein [Terrisporobacter hibernicus]
MIFEKLQGIMEENLSIERDEIKLDSTFASLGIDSLDTFQLIIEIEEEFGIEVEAPESMKTIKDVVNYIEEKTK